ncbi:hypothetical protein C4D60_Mb08t14470 [Musa balbisiana]|uniref:Uncharacterized protein n=1 Tax=Musa balbisiana TaxID=52838 RepID=A0A4S8K3S5_MUSBA|nr:hypothetical protein C4D60_Mb08t14470 [Musa balbisiana]
MPPLTDQILIGGSSSQFINPLSAPPRSTLPSQMLHHRRYVLSSFPAGLNRSSLSNLGLWISTPSQSLPLSVAAPTITAPGVAIRPPLKLNKGHHATPSSPPCTDGILYCRLSSTSCCRSRADVASQLLPSQRSLLLVPVSRSSEKCRCHHPATQPSLPSCGNRNNCSSSSTILLQERRNWDE